MNIRVDDLNDYDHILARKKFVRDCSLPINVYKEPYFTLRMETIDPVYQATMKYEKFLKEVSGFGNIRTYLDFYSQVQSNAIMGIKKADGYKELVQTYIERTEIDKSLDNISNSDVYKKDNHGKSFISLDIRHSNFHTFKFMDKGILGGAETYEDFIVQYCGEGFDHIIESRFMRQVIFGNCNPKMQNRISKYIMGILINEVIIPMYGLDKIEQYTIDEVVISVEDVRQEKLLKIDELYRRLREFRDKYGVELKMDLFTLHNIKDTDFYIKDILITTQPKFMMELKKVDIETVPFIMRALLGEEVKDHDKVVNHDGKLATLIDYPIIDLSDLNL